jgi:hypothetical protein
MTSPLILTRASQHVIDRASGDYIGRYYWNGDYRLSLTFPKGTPFDVYVFTCGFCPEVRHNLLRQHAALDLYEHYYTEHRETA